MRGTTYVVAKATTHWLKAHPPFVLCEPIHHNARPAFQSRRLPVRAVVATHHTR